MWHPGVSECDQICYKDPVFKDQQWSAYIDRSPGDASYSEVSILTKCYFNPALVVPLLLFHTLIYCLC